ERICDEDAPGAAERVIVRNLAARVPQSGYESLQIAHAQARMRLARGTKFGIHAEMDPDVAPLEPRATALAEFWRFHDLGDSEQPPVELARSLLAARRHRELNMVDSDDRHP